MEKFGNQKNIHSLLPRCQSEEQAGILLPNMVTLKSRHHNMWVIGLAVKNWNNGTMVGQRPWKAAENPELIGMLLRWGRCWHEVLIQWYTSTKLIGSGKLTWHRIEWPVYFLWDKWGDDSSQLCNRFLHRVDAFVPSPLQSRHCASFFFRTCATMTWRKEVGNTRWKHGFFPSPPSLEPSEVFFFGWKIPRFGKSFQWQVFFFLRHREKSKKWGGFSSEKLFFNAGKKPALQTGSLLGGFNFRFP